MKLAFISRFGDRSRAPEGIALKKTGMNVYRIEGVPDESRVFAEPLMEHRVAVLDPAAPRGMFYIRTYNLRDGFHPGSDLRIRIYDGPEDPDLLYTHSSIRPVRVDNRLDDHEVLVQIYSRTFRFPQIEKLEDGAVRVTPLITRSPPTPTETNMEVAIVKTLGPLHSR